MSTLYIYLLPFECLNQKGAIFIQISGALLHAYLHTFFEKYLRQKQNELVKTD